MKLRSTDLPGIGKRLSLETAEGEMLVLIIHHTGRRELYVFRSPDDDEAAFSLGLTAEESRELGAELLGVTYQPIEADKMEVLRGQLVIEWLNLTPSSPLAGRTLGAASIRQQTGASVLGILRGEEVVANPGADQLLAAGDTLLACGTREQVSRLEQLCRA